MKSQGNDGGPAYPTPRDGDIIEGMTVRDRFAEKAMHALVAENVFMVDWSEPEPGKLLDLGVVSYRIADGLIKARSVT